MNDDHKRIIISRISEYRQTGSADNETTPVSPGSRWAVYAMLIPVVIIMAVLGAFFFAAFFALFVIAAAGLGLRLWWLRRKLHKSTRAEEGQYVDIEDAEIVEETETNRKKGK